MASKATLSPALQSHLEAAISPEGRQALRSSLLPALLSSIADIARTLRNSQHVALAGTANAFGDDQLNVDVLAEDIIRDALAGCPSAVTASSEEEPVEKAVEHGASQQPASSERYTVAFDPLDGSSIIAPNWTVGTIVGIWDGDSALSQDPKQRQVAAILGVIGPRTTAVVAVRIPGSDPACFEVGLTDGDGLAWDLIRPRVQLAAAPFKTRYFAPANLRAAGDDPRYMGLVASYIQQGYTLRYSGGLVPDVVHALVKGHGIYVSPVTGRHTAKLRRLYELCPVALVVECAGGRAVDPAAGDDVLVRAIENCDERGGLVCGTGDEVELVRAKLLSTVE